MEVHTVLKSYEWPVQSKQGSAGQHCDTERGTSPNMKCKWWEVDGRTEEAAQRGRKHLGLYLVGSPKILLGGLEMKWSDQRRRFPPIAD